MGFVEQSKCMIQPNIINLHPDEYSQKRHYHPFAVNLDRCIESCNTLNDLFNKVCIPNNTEHLNLSVFNMIAGTNELETLKKSLFQESVNVNLMEKSVSQINDGIKRSVDASVRNFMYVKTMAQN